MIHNWDPRCKKSEQQPQMAQQEKSGKSLSAIKRKNRSLQQNPLYYMGSETQACLIPAYVTIYCSFQFNKNAFWMINHTNS